MSRSLVVLGSLAAAAALLVGSPATAQEGGERATHTRFSVLSGPDGASAGMATGGIPLPYDLGVTDVADLGIWRRTGPERTDVEAIPVQWRVVSRWGGQVDDEDKPIRWAFATFPAATGADYELSAFAGRGTSDDRQALGRDDDDAVRIDTGRISFTVPKDRFAPLAGLSVRSADGTGNLMPLLGDGGLDVTMVNVEPEDRDDPGLQLVDRTYRLSATAADLVQLEHNGPQRSVVRVRGRFHDELGDPLLRGFIGYTMRIIADRGADGVRVMFTLENNGQYGPPSESSITRSEPKWLHIRRLALTVPTGIGGNLQGVTADGTYPLDTINGAPEMRLVQLHEVRQHDDESRNFTYTISGGDNVLGRGDRSDGGFGISGNGGTVLAGMRHFWQNYPKAISFDDGNLAFELWPQEPGQRWPMDEGDLHPRWGDSYQFEGGRHKTYEMSLSFPSQLGDTDVAAHERAMQAPLAIQLPATWVARTGAAGPMAPVEYPVRNNDLSAALRHFARMQRGQVDVTYTDPQGPGQGVPKASLITQRERRGNALPSSLYDLDMYGFMNFGDLPHAGGFSGGHFDWVRAMFMNYFRHGNREFLDIGTEMLRHRYDIDQFHGQERVDPNWSWYNGFQRADFGFHGAYTAKYHPHGESTPHPQYTWLEGLLLAYATTGDEKAFETARENADAFVNYYTHGTNRLDPKVREPLEYYGQLSAMSIAMEQLLAFFEFTGERDYLNAAALIFEDGILFSEEYLGNRGFFGIEGEKQNLFPVVRLMRPLMRMHEVTGDQRALALLLRVLRWIKEEGYHGSGRMVLERYMPLQLPYFWVRRDKINAGDRWFIPYNFMTCDAYAYAYRQTAEPSYIEFARELFRDSIMFYQAPMHQSVPPGFYSEVSYVPRQYPGSETKTGVWFLTAHQWYMMTERELSSESDAPIQLRHDTFFTGYGGERGTTVIEVERGTEGPYIREPKTPIRVAPEPRTARTSIEIGDTILDTNKITLTFRTRELATANVDYRRYGDTVWKSAQAAPHIGNQARLDHTVEVTNLEPDRTYELQILTQDTGNHRASSPILMLRTAATGSRRPDEITRGPTVVPGRKPNEPVHTPTVPTVDPEGTSTARQEIILNEQNARFIGQWAEKKERSAKDGSQRIAGEQTTDDSATWVLKATHSGRYRLYAWWGNFDGASNRTRVEVRDADGYAVLRLNQAATSGRWRLLGEFRMSRGQPFEVRMSNEGASGSIAVDTLRLEPVR